MAKKKKFKATIFRDGPICFIPVTFDPREVFGKIRVPVKVTVNGYTYRSTIAQMGNGPCVPLRKSNREAAGLEGGETLDVTLELDTDERKVTPPSDLVKALRTAKALDRWNDLSFSHQREHVEAIEGAKKPETRARRIAAAVAMLLLIACGGGNEQAPGAAPIYVPPQPPPMQSYAPFQLRWSVLKEASGHWWLEGRVDFGRPENGVARIAVTLREVAVYERALRESGQTVPTTERVEVRDKSPTVEHVDLVLQNGVGFLRIDLGRTRGYEAGDYLVTVQREGTPGDLGGQHQLALQGLNDPIDRRPIIFKR